MVKNLPTNAGDGGSIPVLGRSAGEGNGNPLQYSCLRNPMDRGAWWAIVHRVTNELDTTEWLNNNWSFTSLNWGVPFPSSRPLKAHLSFLTSMNLFHFLSLYWIYYNIVNVFYEFFLGGGYEACGFLAPQPEIEPAPPALEGEVLTSGPAGKSWIWLF